MPLTPELPSNPGQFAPATVPHMGQKRRRRHHTVPKFHLEGFARAGQVRTVELPCERRFLQSTGDASAITDFYTVYDQDGEPSDVLEAGLGDLAAAAAPIIKTLTANPVWPLPAEDRMTVALCEARRQRPATETDPR